LQDIYIQNTTKSSGVYIHIPKGIRTRGPLFEWFRNERL